MKKIIIISIVIILSLFLIGIVKDSLVKSIVTVAAAEVVGAPVQIGGLSLRIVGQSIRITNLKIYNPSGFPKGILLDLPRGFAKYNLGSLLKRKLHLRQLDLEIKEIGIQKNKEGKLNVDSLKVAKKEDGKEIDEPGKFSDLQIDLLNLQMGRVVLKDFSQGGPAKISVYEINLKRSYKNISSSNQLATLILAEPMKAAGIKGAQIYAVSSLAGVAFLPAAAAVTFLGNDSARQEFNMAFNDLYNVSHKVLKRMGKITKENKSSGTISAEVNSASVNLQLKKLSNNKVEIVISARKSLFPKPQIAGGVMYEINESLR